MRKIHVFENAEALSEAAAQAVAEFIELRCRQAGAVHIALAGGTTPRALYARLAGEPWRSRIPWAQVFIYFGDERFVPPDHPDSNYRMAREALLTQVPLPPGNIHPVDTSGTPQQAAAQYGELLEFNLPRDGGAEPVFDLVLLGMGDDGHTASLFPGTPVLEEQRAAVSAVHVAKFSSWRVTVTMPVINRARRVMLLVTGAGKAGVLSEVLGTDASPAHYPVQLVTPRGQLDWYLDAAAAAQLGGEA